MTVFHHTVPRDCGEIICADFGPGLATQFDPNDGTSAGPAFVPTDIDPNNQTRSDARRTYYDPYVSSVCPGFFYLCFCLTRTKSLLLTLNTGQQEQLSRHHRSACYPYFDRGRGEQQ